MYFRSENVLQNYTRNISTAVKKSFAGNRLHVCEVRIPKNYKQMS